ncbi:MAG: NAD/NADP octopine/nopaline dehydrogenase family protein [Phycisphaerae bacterium]|nr:NAD/NADP octopine/nopaline dehydrogenase family protein [Phycisphaerae bacterium]
MNITIVGAGNSGSAHAAMFSKDGHAVTLYEFMPNDNFRRLRAKPELTVTYNGERHTVPLHRVTDDETAAFADAEVVFILTRTIAHPILAERVGPYLRNGQLVVLAPGYGGSLYFLRATKSKDILYCEGESIPFDSRLGAEPGQVDICFINVRNPMGFLPAARKAEGIAKLRELLPSYCLRRNILESALSNPNLVVHTVGAIMAVARIEHSKGEYWMYRESFTPSIMNLLYALDAERLAVLEAMDLPKQSFLEGFCYRTYEDQSVDPDVAFRHYAEVGGPKGPSDAETRYITEDVPMGLCLLSSLGEKLSVPTPVCDSLIQIAGAIGKRDYRAEARTTRALGIADLSAESLQTLLATGDVKRVSPIPTA